MAHADDGTADLYGEPVVVPIEDVLDLHPFQPRDILDVVDAYLEAACEKGLREVRLIHGRGKGVQRARIQQLLEADARVLRWEEAPPQRGGWGATLAWLDVSSSAGTGMEPRRQGTAAAARRRE